MAIVKRNICKCDICDHEWLQREKDELPACCANCKNPRWNKKRVR